MSFSYHLPPNSHSYPQRPIWAAALILALGALAQNATAQTPTIRFKQAAIAYPLGLPFNRTSHSGVLDGSFSGWQTFENFAFSAAQKITEFRWQGIYWDDANTTNNPSSPNTKEWELTIWSDDDGKPGTMLYSETRESAEVPWSTVGQIEFWTTSSIDRLEFSFELTTPFEAEPDTTYWISAMSSSPGNFWPFFLTSTGVRQGMLPPMTQEESITASIAADGCFQKDIITNDTYLPTGDRAIAILTLPANDADADGMDDTWEETHGLDTESDDSLGDDDEDGLDNLREFELGTNPGSADTDGDGLDDRLETNTGVFVDADDRGTSPFLTDSDGDGLSDSLENPNLAFAGSGQPGSNPLSADTDRDGIPDGDEIRLLTDPTATDSDGDGISDAWEIGNATDPNSPSSPASITLSDPDNPDRLWTSLQTIDSFQSLDDANYDRSDVTFRAVIDFEEKTSGRREVIFEAGGGTVGFSLVYEAGNRLVLRASGINGTSLAIIDYMLNDAQLSAGEIEVLWAFDVANADETQTIGLWLGGKPAAELTKELGGDWSGGNKAAFGVDDTAIAGTGFNQALRGINFASGTINLSEGLQMFSNRYPSIEEIVRPDNDGDGMHDYYEDLHGLDNELDDAGLDLDGDGVLNLDEFRDGTDPNNADTDGDGLGDEVESGSGKWISATQTGTDPTNPDSDGDGLGDGVENPNRSFDPNNPLEQPGTDPNEIDSDGDGFPDLREAIQGSDPTDPGSRPVVGAKSYKQDFDGYPDGTKTLNDGSIIGSSNGIAQVIDNALWFTDRTTESTRSSFRLPPIDGSSAGWTATFDFTIVDQPGGDSPADGFTFNYGAIQDLTHQGSGPSGNGNAEAGMGGTVISFQVDTWQNGNTDNPPGVGIFQSGTQLFRDNGIVVPDNRSVYGTATIRWTPEVVSFETTGLATNADYLDVAHSFAGADSYGWAFSARTGGATEDLIIDNLVITAGSAPPLRIGDITFDAAEGSVSIAWQSRRGRTYAVDRSTDLSATGWEELDDGIEGVDGIARFEDQDPILDGGSAFYRVRELD